MVDEIYGVDKEVYDHLSPLAKMFVEAEWRKKQDKNLPKEEKIKKLEENREWHWKQLEKISKELDELEGIKELSYGEIMEIAQKENKHPVEVIVESRGMKLVFEDGKEN